MRMPDWFGRLLGIRLAGAECSLIVFFSATCAIGCGALARVNYPDSTTQAVCSVLGVLFALFTLAVLAQFMHATVQDRRENVAGTARWSAEEEDWARARRRHSSVVALHTEHELDPDAVFFRLGPEDPATRRLHTALLVADELRTGDVPDAVGRQAYVHSVAELDSAWAAAGTRVSDQTPGLPD